MRGHLLSFLESSEWIKRAKLLKMVRDLGIECNDRLLRKEIEGMITEDGHCIASSSIGYKLIRNGNDLDEATEYLNKKAAAIAIRKNHLIKNFFDKYESKESKKQLNLFV